MTLLKNSSSQSVLISRLSPQKMGESLGMRLQFLSVVILHVTDLVYIVGWKQLGAR